MERTLQELMQDGHDELAAELYGQDAVDEWIIEEATPDPDEGYDARKVGDRR